MSGSRREPLTPWLDELGRKHECGPSLYDYRTIELTDKGETVRVSIPDAFDGPERPEVRKVLRSEDLLVLIGRHESVGEEARESTFLMVARAAEDQVFVVHVFHELFPWALTHLGLGEPAGSAPPQPARPISSS